MHSINDSGKGRYWGDEPHPFLKRVLDRLPAGRLLLAGETAGSHAVYAAEAGWEVHAVGFKPEDQETTLQLAKEKEENIHFTLYQEGASICEGLEFDAVVLLFVQLPPQLRSSFHRAICRCLKTDGGNLFLLAYSEEQPPQTHARLPEVRYRETDLVQDFKGLQIDLLQHQEEKLPDTDEKINLIHLTAVRNSEHDGSDAVSFSLDG